MNKSSIGILIAALILVGGGLYYFLREVPEPPPSSTTTVEKKAKDEGIQFLGSSLSETKDGKLQWEVNAEQIQVEAETKLLKLTNLQAQIYQVNSSGKIMLTAQQGQMDTTTRVMSLQGSIKAVTDKGAEFASNVGKWFSKERRFIAEGNVQYRQQDITIMGDSLETNNDFQQVRVTGNARAELRRTRQ